jgi:Undecaprenyl-phosphate glucose phosphotransferase
MLKQHNQYVLTALVIADALAVAVAWLASYWIRFSYLHVDPAKGVPDLSDRFLTMLPLVVSGHLLIFYRLRLYRPRRSERMWREMRDIFKAFVVAIVVIVMIDYALPASNKISRRFIATYAIIGTTTFALFRFTVRALLRRLRRHGFNRRYAAIVGTGRAAQQLLHALQRNAWTGIHVAYFVGDDPTLRSLRELPVRGPLAGLRDIVDQHPVDAIFIALPDHQAHRTGQVMEALALSMADVQVVPDVNPAYSMRPTVSTLDGVPILSLRQTPLYGWNAILKRGFDLVVGAICLLVAAPLMLVIAALIRLDSRGPILYRQRRTGLDGQEFTMLKFRTMRPDAESGGPVWSRTADDRRTRIGELLRRTSLDELPNLFNVLAGHMSLVGPRPERPEFIAEFKRVIPNYMLRHKMKAGMTGFAQINGWRGDTSLRKRIRHDMYYIRNWSLWLDVQIMLQTLARVWFSRHEVTAAAAKSADGLLARPAPDTDGDINDPFRPEAPASRARSPQA